MRGASVVLPGRPGRRVRCYLRGDRGRAGRGGRPVVKAGNGNDRGEDRHSQGAGESECLPATPDRILARTCHVSRSTPALVNVGPCVSQDSNHSAPGFGKGGRL